jgi:phage gpG-like protein
MSTVTVQWDDSKFLAALQASVSIGLDAAAIVVQRKAQQNLSRQGVFGGKTGPQRLAKAKTDLEAVRTGQLDFASLGGQRRRNVNVAAVLDRTGDVDPPGGMPRMRSGTLRKSISIDSPAPNVRKIGPNASVPYAAIHEFGGPMKGGRPFLIIDGRFIPLGKNSKARPMGYTKPYNMPARPYMRPSLAQSRTELVRAFEENTRAAMKRRGY